MTNPIDSMEIGRRGWFRGAFGCRPIIMNVSNYPRHKATAYIEQPVAQQLMLARPGWWEILSLPTPPHPADIALRSMRPAR